MLMFKTQILISSDTSSSVNSVLNMQLKHQSVYNIIVSDCQPRILFPSLYEDIKCCRIFLTIFFGPG